jgi:hypothetical protein
MQHGDYFAQSKGTATQLNKDYVLSLSEWGLIEPVIRAHCELIQAQRVEGTGSLGGERFGLSVSEATANYKEAKEDLKERLCRRAIHFYILGKFYAGITVKW